MYRHITKHLFIAVSGLSVMGLAGSVQAEEAAKSVVEPAPAQEQAAPAPQQVAQAPQQAAPAPQQRAQGIILCYSAFVKL